MIYNCLWWTFWIVIFSFGHSFGLNRFALKCKSHQLMCFGVPKKFNIKMIFWIDSFTSLILNLKIGDLRALFPQIIHEKSLLGFHFLFTKANFVERKLNIVFEWHTNTGQFLEFFRSRFISSSIQEIIQFIWFNCQSF